ncbi:ORF004R [Infectious spleen and kidney necrosis virus]|uniref:ORF004R n=1 Tax=Infectious spleen and kidney necrosis virus TaxID=180170 RepID=A0A140G0I2_ISKNV|nr:ORF004R [Infectious spleen and kidney necrosis virus]
MNTLDTLLPCLHALSISLRAQLRMFVSHLIATIMSGMSMRTSTRPSINSIRVCRSANSVKNDMRSARSTLS